MLVKRPANFRLHKMRIAELITQAFSRLFTGFNRDSLWVCGVHDRDSGFVRHSIGRGWSRASVAAPCCHKIASHGRHSNTSVSF